jgi:site-specific recombinase XerD
LRAHRQLQRETRLKAGSAWVDQGLVFCTAHGTALDAANVRRAFRAVAKSAGLHSESWTPRELRHSFVWLLFNSGTPFEDIVHLVEHANTKTTEQALS